MRKNKISKLNPWLVAILTFLPLQKILAYITPGPTLYGPMQPSVPLYGPIQPNSLTSIEIAIVLLKLAAILLIPIVIIVGIIMYIVKKVKKRHAQKTAEIGRPQNLE